MYRGPSYPAEWSSIFFTVVHYVWDLVLDFPLKGFGIPLNTLLLVPAMLFAVAISQCCSLRLFDLANLQNPDLIVEVQLTSEWDMRRPATLWMCGSYVAL